MLREISSYSFRLGLREFRESCGMCRGEQNIVRVEAYIEGEPVCNDGSGDSSSPFFFVYDTCFKKLGLRLPF